MNNISAITIKDTLKIRHINKEREDLIARFLDGKLTDEEKERLSKNLRILTGIIEYEN